MIIGKLAWFMIVQFTIFKGCSSSNTTQDIAPSNTTLQVPSPSQIQLPQNSTTNSSETTQIATTPTQSLTSANETQLEILEIFQGDSNTSTTAPTDRIIVDAAILTNCTNTGTVNVTCVDHSWNNTLKTNYTTVAEAVGASEGFPDGFGLQNTAAIATGIFLVSAVIGYFSCVGYRRFLQRKYGNSQILVGEEVYDTSDLRYFEI